MKLPGLMRMISMVSGLVLAIPMAIIGFEFLAQGRTAFGIGFLFLALALLFLPEYVLSQLPRPRAALNKRIARFRRND